MSLLHTVNKETKPHSGQVQPASWKIMIIKDRSNLKTTDNCPNKRVKDENPKDINQSSNLSRYTVIYKLGNMPKWYKQDVFYKMYMI